MIATSDARLLCLIVARSFCFSWERCSASHAL